MYVDAKLAIIVIHLASIAVNVVSKTMTHVGTAFQTLVFVQHRSHPALRASRGGQDTTLILGKESVHLELRSTPASVGQCCVQVSLAGRELP